MFPLPSYKKAFSLNNFCKIHEHEYIGISFCVEESKLSYSALNGHGEDFGQNFFTFLVPTMLR